LACAVHIIFAAMKFDTVIFDMDGLLIDSEPLWKEAADELLLSYKKQLTPKQYSITTGLRTKEFLEYWFTFFNIPLTNITTDETILVDKVINLVKQKGKVMPGVEHIFKFFIERNFKIGLASSSPFELINVVTDILGIQSHLNAVTSAAHLQFGKPHPEVYLNCAVELKSLPQTCICFEDSFNGLIAVKGAKMKCVAVPGLHDNKDPKWGAADAKISTLNNFNELILDRLQYD